MTEPTSTSTLHPLPAAGRDLAPRPPPAPVPHPRASAAALLPLVLPPGDQILTSAPVDLERLMSAREVPATVVTV